MKKLLIAVFILAFTSSCGSYVDNNSSKAMRISGILSEQSASDLNPGTHLLVTDELKVYPVSSILVRLSDPEFLGNKVELIGAFDESLNLFSVSGISILEKKTIVDEEDKPSLLVDYKNSDYGFQLKYYDNWTFAEESGSVVFSSLPYSYNNGEALDLVKIEQFQFSYDPSVFDSNNDDSPLKNYVANYHPEISDFSRFYVKTGPDFLDSIKLENEFGGYDVFLYRNGLIYVISFIPFDALSVSSDNSRIFNEMLNSFRFIGFTIEDNADDNLGLPDDISEDSQLSPEVIDLNDFSYDEPSEGFSSFESKSYSFKAEYPSKWYYEGTNSLSNSSNYSFVFSSQENPIEFPGYTLSIFSNKPAMDFKTFDLNGSNLDYLEQDGQFYAIKIFNGKFFMTFGNISNKNLGIKTLVGISAL